MLSTVISSIDMSPTANLFTVCVLNECGASLSVCLCVCVCVCVCVVLVMVMVDEFYVLATMTSLFIIRLGSQ
jgi:hypothetical protein